MLGQRIIESYSDLEDDNSSLLRPEPYTGLTIRRIKSAGLRIVTESESSSPDASQDHLNTLPRRYRQSYLAVRTPDTSHTFGFPNPSMLSPERLISHTPVSSPSSASTELLTARRLSRYSRAESALQSAVEASSVEISPQELQIRALEEATAILSEQARDAQACAERLRAYLADKELSMEEVRSLKRQRWLEEHRSISRQEQSFRTRVLMTKLSSPVQEEGSLFKSPSPMTRQEANLTRFLQYSPTRIDIPHARISPLPPTIYRRKTICNLRPMRLRPSAMELAVRSPLRLHSRSRSLDGGHSRRNSDSTDATFVSQDSSGRTAVAPTSSLPRKLSLSLSPPPFPNDGEGSISIEKLARLRSRDELLAEVGDVTLPDYAIDLLEDLVASSLDVSLQDIAVAESAPVLQAPFFPVIAPEEGIDADSAKGLRTGGRVRSQSDIPPSRSISLNTSVHRRSLIPSKSPFRQSLHVPKFSSVRLSSPSLLPVPETMEAGQRSRPHSSMSGRYPLDSSSAINERWDEEHQQGQDPDHRRFSVVSFRRLEREGSTRGGVFTRLRRRLSSLSLRDAR
ncbi:hypothetical protein BV20DRAFT_952469 [Pilatotrama ljubarskyi]|nr:hypothetical protein BV20DRAFT_952469 [Pilatotrama ljubarskyi]